MRNWIWSMVAVAALTGGFLGCGGSSNRPSTTGNGGAGGNTGTAGTGAAGTGAAGTGVAGTGAAGTGAAGTGAAGTGTNATGGAGTTGAAGDGSAGTAPPPPPTYCETHTQRDLPYSIATDFKVVHTLNNNNAAGTAWKYLANPTCDATTFPPFTPPPSDGGADADGGSDGGVADGGADASVSADAADAAADGADDAATLALDEDGGVADAAADAPVDAASPTDVPVDGGTGDVVADGTVDGSVAAPACYEFSYNPADCTGTCWAGSVFQIDDMQPLHPDGVCIKPGAMSVEFWARSSRADARVKFGAVGEGMNTRERYLNITTTWTKYSIPIDGGDQTTYNSTSGNMNGVWNAFSVVVEPQDHVGGTYILVKDIRWLATP